MPRKELTTAASALRDDTSIQVEMTLPRHARRDESGNSAQSGQLSGMRTRPGIPRVTRLMALAIKFQDMVDRGEVRDYADLARLGYVSRARVTQIMNLLNLHPKIQEQLLFRPGDLPSERNLRLLVAQVEWTAQLEFWNRLAVGGDPSKSGRRLG